MKLVLDLHSHDEPDPDPEPDPRPPISRPAEADDSFFSGPLRDLTRPSLTFREGVLASLLGHAILFIAILLAPPAMFSILQTPRPMRLPEDEPIRMKFVQEKPKSASELRLSPNASDKDTRASSERTPPNPTKTGPFALGNTRMKVPDPFGSKGGAPPSTPPEAAPEPQPAPDESRAAKNAIDARAGTGPLYVPPKSDEDAAEDAAEKGRRLKQTLARMGSEGLGSAGSPLHYDNPSGGLNTPTGSLSFDTKGFDWGPYSRRIYWIIWKNWHDRMPPAIYAGLKGQVRVHFVIHRDGTITDVEILNTSGIPAYDSAATLALEASSPLPPLPDNFPKESDGVTGRFLYNMWDDDED